MTATPAESPLPPIRLNPEQIALLRASFGEIQQQGEIAVLTFYRNLFALDPSLKALFHTSIDLQARKLMDALSFVINGLEQPDQIRSALEALGRRHVSYGTREEHYPIVLQAMLEMLKQTLGSGFTPEVRDAWKQALGFVSEAMQRGARSVTALRYPGDGSGRTS